MRTQNEDLSTVSLLLLYLIRHGETEWSLLSQHTSTTDIPLTARGKVEAGKLRAKLAPIHFNTVLTSPRQRAEQTCQLSGVTPPASIEPDLVEWNYGDYEGKRSADIRALRPGWNIFRDGCPGGETPNEVSERADHLIARLRLLTGSVALFSHGQFGCALVARWIGLPILMGQHFLLGTASISILSFDPHHPEIPVLERLNYQ